ncbi:MAG: Xaa-Pro dipeptidase [Woeseiaceae bacterium]|nr:Xaa-Pro dipeptidase [Woeseiaceae bacterium]
MSNHFDGAAVSGGNYAAHVQEIAARHDHALEIAGASHAVIFSGAPRIRFLDDNAVPFVANPHFVSWLPLTDTPHCYIVYERGATPTLVYFQEKDYWHAPPAAPDGFWTSHFDIRIVHEPDDIPRHLPPDRDKCILIGEIQDEAQALGIERVNPDSALNALHYARARKTAYELDCLRAASLRGARGHRAAEQAFRAGKSEYDIHLDYCRATGHTERELPYGNIIALNEHGAVLHYQHQSREIPATLRSFLIDAGASVNGYASDITRTWSFEDREFAALIERMEELQRGLVAQVRAGLEFAELHIEAHRQIAALLAELGFASGSVDALIESGVTAAFYPHGLGHFLGIQVHDVGGFMANETGATIDRPSGHPFLRLTRTLEADHVLTIEPGIYAIEMLQENLVGTPAHRMVNHERVAWLQRFGGIRIEDDVRVLPDGCENLTRDAFSALDAA